MVVCSNLGSNCRRKNSTLLFTVLKCYIIVSYDASVRIRHRVMVIFSNFFDKKSERIQTRSALWTRSHAWKCCILDAYKRIPIRKRVVMLLYVKRVLMRFFLSWRVWTPENVAFWTRPNALSSIALNAQKRAPKPKNGYMGA